MFGFILMESAKVPEKIDISVIDNLLELMLTRLVALGGRIIIAVIVYIIGAWIVSLLRKLVNRVLVRKKIDGAVVTFVNSMTSVLLKVLLAILIIGILGIPTTSFAAILAAGGLAVGMAMKDNLSNFAGGIMILLNKPFQLNDRILVQGQDGVVQEIGILYTVLLTGDGKTVYMPNGPLSTGSIVNFSTRQTRRVDISFNISYGNNADDLIQIISDLVDAHPLVLKDPAPFVGVTTVYNGNFDITVRAWGLNGDNGKINIDLNESIYRTLSEKGIFVSSSLTVRMAQS